MGFFKDVIATILGRKSYDKPIEKKIVIKQSEVKPATIRKIGVMRKNSKHTKVLNHLIRNGSINRYTAKLFYNVTRLSSIINRLRNRGYNITSVPYLQNSVNYIYTK
jgi:hypothetical protein